MHTEIAFCTVMFFSILVGKDFLKTFFSLIFSIKYFRIYRLPKIIINISGKVCSSSFQKWQLVVSEFIGS